MEVPQLLMKTLSPLLTVYLLILRLERTWQITDRKDVNISSSRIWLYAV